MVKINGCSTAQVFLTTVTHYEHLPVAVVYNRLNLQTKKTKLFKIGWCMQ